MRGVNKVAEKDNNSLGGKSTLNVNSFVEARDLVGEYLLVLAEKYPNLVVVDADVRVSARTQKFFKKYPERTFDVGVAEQNAASIAAGLAHEGFIPFVSSFACFMSMRSCEQIRSDICYGNLPAILLGLYAGYSNGISGATHSGVEDCAIMSSFAGMTVLEPGDPWMVKKMLDAAIEKGGPVYIRLSREAGTSLYAQDYKYEIGKALIPREGNDGAFVASGPCVRWAIEASEIIEKKCGAKMRVVDCHTIKPIDKEAIGSAAKTGRIVCIQDHIIYGGLGYHVGAAIAESGIGCKFKILGCPDKFVPIATPDFLYRENEMDTEGLVKNMMAFL